MKQRHPDSSAEALQISELHEQHSRGLDVAGQAEGTTIEGSGADVVHLAADD